MLADAGVALRTLGSRGGGGCIRRARCALQPGVSALQRATRAGFAALLSSPAEGS